MTFWGQCWSLWDPTRELRAQAEQEAGRYPLQGLSFQVRRRLGAPDPGGQRTFFHGQGLAFANLREYQAGDDIRKMDWRVFARTREPHIKTYEEERQLAVWFVVDATASMHTGQRVSKVTYAQDLVAALGTLAIEAGHRVGLVLWHGHERPDILRPRPHAPHLAWMTQALAEEATRTSEDPPKSWPCLAPLVGNHGMVFVLSDFQFLAACPEAPRLLGELRPKHTVYSLMLVDPMEAALPDHRGWLPVRQPGTSEVFWINTGIRRESLRYQQAFQARQADLVRQCATWGHVHEVETRLPLIETLISLLRAA